MRNFDPGSSQTAEVKSGWVAPRVNGDSSFYIGYGGATAAGAGKVYIEAGTTIPAQDPTMKFTTRRMYLADLGHEWEVGEVYGYALNYDGTGPQVSYQLLTTKTNDTGETSTVAKTLTLGGQALHKVIFRRMCEGARISFIATASAYSQERLVIDGTDFGLEDSGR
jgi:hypothetical protein